MATMTLFRTFSDALARHRAARAAKTALLEMDPHLLADIGAGRGSAARTGLATLNPGVLSCTLFPGARGR
jgi:uncharacterized protein YjiS (DUF1127 family)